MLLAKPTSTPTCRLYLITPPAISDFAAFAGRLSEALEDGDVAAVQLRLKGAPDEAVAEAASRLLPVCRARGVALILNDRPDLAAALDCDGVHVGREDPAVREARRIVGPDRIVGATCHDSRHLAMEAAEAGADYVAFGAFFPTATKAAPTRADPEILEIWQEIMLTPCVAIGGITPENCAPLVRAGADSLAACGAVWGDPRGPAAAVRRFHEAMAEASRPVAPREHHRRAQGS